MSVSAPFTVDVSIFGAPINAPLGNPHQLKVIQEEFSHDIAQVMYWGGDVESSSMQSGTPIFIAWGRRGALRYFYGYVNHAKRVNNALAQTKSLIERNAVIVTAMGASWPMRQKDNRTWYNYTIPQVLTEVAATFGLDIQVVPHSTQWPSIPMAGRSYWKFCVDLCQRIGYTFYCNGIQLVAKPRQTNPNNLSSLSAVYDYKANPMGLPIFTPTVGATSPGGGQLMNRQLAGVNPRTSQLVYTATSGSPQPSVLGNVAEQPVFTHIEHVPVDSQDECNAKVNGAGQLNQLYITASALASGSALVSQGSLVYVQNANGGQNGLWWVCSATHEVDANVYQMPLELGRDSLGATLSLAVVPNTQSPPKAKLSSSQYWISA